MFFLGMTKQLELFIIPDKIFFKNRWSFPKK